MCRARRGLGGGEAARSLRRGWHAGRDGRARTETRPGGLAGGLQGRGKAERRGPRSGCLRLHPPDPRGRTRDGSGPCAWRRRRSCPICREIPGGFAIAGGGGKAGSRARRAMTGFVPFSRRYPRPCTWPGGRDDPRFRCADLAGGSALLLPPRRSGAFPSCRFRGTTRGQKFLRAGCQGVDTGRICRDPPGTS